MNTNKNLICFNLHRKITDSSYRSDQILKTSASDTDRFSHDKKIQQFIEQSKQRQQTSQFINKSHSNVLKSMLSPLQNQELIRLSSPKSSKHQLNNTNFFQKMLNVSDNISKRQQILDVERQFTQQINEQNRKEYVNKIEQFIRDLLFEEFRELSFLFNSFLREFQFHLTEQSLQLNIEKKLNDYQIHEKLQQQEQIHEDTIKQIEQKMNLILVDLNSEKNKNQQLEKDVNDLVRRNTILIQKVEQRNKLISASDKKIKQQEQEVQILRQKLTCYENKLTLSYKRISLLNRQQSIISNHTPIQNEKISQDDQFNESLSNNSINIDQFDLKEEEQLNLVEINYERIIKQSQQEQQVEYDLLPYYTKIQETQTDLIMLDHQFDYINQQNLNNTAKFAEFVESVGRKGSEDLLIDQIIDDSQDQIDLKKAPELNKSQYSMLKSAISQDSQQQHQVIPQLIRCDSKLINTPNQLIKKESKQKQIISFVTFLKSRMHQQELELQDLNNNLQQRDRNQTQLDEKLNDLQSENEKLQHQLSEFQVKFSQQQLLSFSDIKQEEDVRQSTDSQNPIIQKRTSMILKPGQIKEIKKQNKAPQLGQKVVIQYNFQKDQSKKIIEKLKTKQLNKFNNFMPLKLVLKYITTLYHEKLLSQKEQKQVKDQDMASYIYNYYLQQFGFTKVTEQKFSVLILSIIKNVKIVRVNVFAKFLGLVEQNINYSVEELAKYLEALDYMNQQQNLGQTIKDNESEIKQYIPFVRALAYISQLVFSPSNEELASLKQDIEQLKEIDPKNINKQGIIDFDLMMIKVLQVFRNNIEKTKLYVINAFSASDLDGNGMCNLDEFLILNKYIEPEKYDEEKWIEVFEDNADINSEEERALSFERFSILCMEYNLFSDHSQNKFLQIKNNVECLTKFEQLREQWNAEFINYTMRLQNAQMDEQEKEQWSKILTVLNQKIIENPEQKKPLLIAYKIFLNESRVNKS